MKKKSFFDKATDWLAGIAFSGFGAYIICAGLSFMKFGLETCGALIKSESEDKEL